MLRTTLLPAGLIVAVPLIAWAAPAYADAPTALPPLAVSPDPVIPEGQLVVRGSGCVGTGGTPGVVSVSLQSPGGGTLSDTVTAIDANGGWAAAYTAPAAPGSYQITATCDLYSTATPYPAASITVAPSGASTPVAGQPPAPAPQPGSSTPAAPSTSSAGAAAGTTDAGTRVVREPAAVIPADDLAATGVPLGQLGTASAALLAAGVVTTLAGRRRRG